MSRLAWIPCALAACAVLAGCGGESQPVDASVSAGNPAVLQVVDLAIPVEAQTPSRGDISAYFETNARVVAERRVDVTAQAVGRCVELLADEGDPAKRGQVLAELDKQEALAALNQAEVQVRQQKAAYDRARMMWKEGLGPQVEYENAKFAYEQAQASREVQKVQLANLTIRAPIDGIVTRRNIHLGTLVTSGTPVFTLVDPTSYILEINPPERDLGRLRTGQEARVRVDAVPDREFRMTIRRINPAVENGTVRATLDFQPGDRDVLKEGAFARVALVMETRQDALLLPKDAVLEESGREYVFVIEPAPETPESLEMGAQERKLTARRVDIETGLETAEAVEVVSGLDDHSLVATLGQHTLRTGSEVKLTNADEAVAAALDVTPEDALAAAQAKRAEGGEPAAREGRRR